MRGRYFEVVWDWVLKGSSVHFRLERNVSLIELGFRVLGLGGIELLEEGVWTMIDATI